MMLFGLILATSALSNAQTLVPTWSENVACILYSNCTTCHHDGGIAPFSLMTYQEANAAAFGVMNAVNSGSMPPWPPNRDYRQFAHERYLTQQEKDIITNWVNGGRPEGNPANAPMPPVYVSSEEITNPHLTLTIPNYTVSTVGNDVYRCFAIPTNLGQDVYITDLEVVPGNREVVHHVLVYADDTNLPIQLDAADPQPGYTNFGGTGSSSSKLIGAWVPGQRARHYPSGMGVKMVAGSTIVLQIHYPATANGQQDQTKINIRYTSGGFVRELFIASPLHHGDLNEGALFIPANQTRTFTADYALPNNVNVTVLDVGPHMHLIGRSIKSWASTPQGTVNLIDIPSWNFHWQGFYEFRQPLKLPAGSTLHSAATYDNTLANPFNPNNPPQLVTAGEATDEEMMLIYFTYTVYFPGDENIVIDTSTVKPTHNNCDYTYLVGLDDQELDVNQPFPNPTDGPISLHLPENVLFDVVVIDATGRNVRQMSSVSGQTLLDMAGLGMGLYQVRVSSKHGQTVYRVLVK